MVRRRPKPTLRDHRRDFRNMIIKALEVAIALPRVHGDRDASLARGVVKDCIEFLRAAKGADDIVTDERDEFELEIKSTFDDDREGREIARLENCQSTTLN